MEVAVDAVALLASAISNWDLGSHEMPSGAEGWLCHHSTNRCRLVAVAWADGDAPSCFATTSAAADPAAAAGATATLLPLLNEGTTFTYATNEQNATTTNIVDSIMTRTRERRPLPFASMAFAD